MPLPPDLGVVTELSAVTALLLSNRMAKGIDTALHRF